MIHDKIQATGIQAQTQTVRSAYNFNLIEHFEIFVNKNSNEQFFQFDF